LVVARRTRADRDPTARQVPAPATRHEEHKRAEGRLVEALDAGRRATEPRETLGLSHQAVEQGLVEALEASVALDKLETTRELLAALRFRELEMPLWVAVTEIEHAEILDGGPEAKRLLAAAPETLERLDARPWLERASTAVLFKPR
jgi:hypothetical protein